jgi:hypothetical protein
MGQPLVARSSPGRRQFVDCRGHGLGMTKLLMSAILTTGVLAAPLAHADTRCVLKVTRTACAGKEKESFSKCDGKASCDVNDAAATEADCAAAAVKACDNAPDRQSITKSKTITALFGGKPVQAGKNFCVADRPDFNKCSK